jgi:hypothetical protein
MAAETHALRTNQSFNRTNELREGRMNSIEAELADEMQRIAHTAAEPVKGGETVKRQMGRAWEALGHPAWWRLRAAWNGLAGPWRGTAHEDFRRRDAERRRKENAASASAGDLGGLYLGMANRLAAIDPEFHKPDIDRLLHAARALGAGRGAMDGARADD